MSIVHATYNEKDPETKEVISATVYDVDYNFGENLEEATQLFGEKVVLSAFQASATVTLQSRIRSLAKQGKDADEIKEICANWKPGVTAPRKSPVDKVMATYEKMSDDEKAKFLEALKG